MNSFDYWIRRSPFFEATRRAGCSKYSFANHMYQPAGYADQDPLAAYWHLVNGVTLWDVGTERQVEITGTDALAFANSLTPRDLTKCRIGRCCYTLVTTKEGGIVNDPVLLRLNDNHFWLSTSDSDLLLWVKGVAVHSGLDVEVCEPDVSPIQIQGPKSSAVIDALFGGRVVLAPYEFVQTDLDGIPVVVSRTGWSGEVGYEIFLRDGRYGDALWDRALAAGEPFQIAVTGPSDANRVEAGILAYRSDMDLQTNPFEAGLERFINLDAPADFIGKDALLKVRAQGITRRLVGIRILGDALQAPFEERWPVLIDGVPAGEVTVAVYSPRLQMNIGYAMVPIGSTAADTQLDIEAPWGRASAIVSAMPFIKRR
ncbi:MAG: glycine cleavage T C-terminal barrel domain-containing protein [Steroidobacteraceae bacterium]